MKSRLLGISAFAGFFVMLIGWPFNNFISQRAIRIQKGLSSARDKRMGVLNEIITTVRLNCFHDVTTLTIFATLDEIHQVLCVGRSLDSTYS
jgi:hypothetical protein